MPKHRTRSRVLYDWHWIELRPDGIYVRSKHSRKDSYFKLPFEHVFRLCQRQTELFSGNQINPPKTHEPKQVAASEPAVPVPNLPEA